MIISAHSCAGQRGRKLVLVFGVGLIGGSLLRSLRRSEVSTPLKLPVDWYDRSQRAADLLVVAQSVLQQHDCCGPLCELDVVWTAGKAGFSAEKGELQSEIDAFTDVVEWTRKIRAAFPNASVAFHMVSSAGGLFEGQRLVDRASVPRPLRPYGEAKLVQEKIVDQLCADMVAYVYRPSSVYGFSGVGGRSGLVNTLLEKSKKHEASHIFGGLDTLRDYVLSSDIGDYMKDKIEHRGTISRTFLLANGKPTSVHEMLYAIGEVIGHPLYVTLDVRPYNARHITFRRSALPPDWRPTDIKVGIRYVARHLGSSFESNGVFGLPC